MASRIYRVEYGVFVCDIKSSHLQGACLQCSIRKILAREEELMRNFHVKGVCSFHSSGNTPDPLHVVPAEVKVVGSAVIG